MTSAVGNDQRGGRGNRAIKLEASKRAKQGRNLKKRGRKGEENDNGSNSFKTGVQKY
jgi:hypothetical protein